MLPRAENLKPVAYGADLPSGSAASRTVVADCFDNAPRRASAIRIHAPKEVGLFQHPEGIHFADGASAT